MSPSATPGLAPGAHARPNPGVLAVIPARGGSKGIPRKNVRPLAGRPLLAHIVMAAREADSVTRVVVSTDDAEIAAAAQRYGAEVIDRPAAISGDDSASEDAVLHAVETLREREGYVPEVVVFLQATAPLTIAEDIDGTVSALRDSDADTAVAVTPFHYFLWRESAGGDAVGINHDKSHRPLRQHREPQYLETGAIYVMRTSGLLEARHRFFGKTAMHVMPAERRLEIDEPVDMIVAEALLRERASARAGPALPSPPAAIVFDFDGVFTDNRVIVLESGLEAVVADRADGLGVARLRERGIPVVVMSSEVNPVVEARCAKLRIECLAGIDDKLAELEAWLRSRKLPIAETVFVGNDVNDLDCMRAVGCGVAVADARAEVKKEATIVLNSAGGRGAVRELADLVLADMTPADGSDA